MSDHGPIVWIAGTSWDGVAGTDRCIVEALARLCPVLWVDPPTRPSLKKARLALRGRRKARVADGPAGLERVSDSILRLRVTVLPGVTRPGIRRVTAVMLDRAITSALSRAGWEPEAVVVAMPMARFPQKAPGCKILYLTDDWLEGSRLMGLSRSVIRRVLDSNLAQADGVAAVSEALLTRFQPLNPSASGKAFAVIPNGCLEPAETAPAHRESTACLVGQLNERLDLDLLEAVQASGVEMVLIGPRADRTPAFARRLDTLLEAGNVRWMGRLETGELHQELSVHGVGLTPYAESAFNRASFPLKTLEYLAAGLGVVSTDMPSARWLDTSLISLQSEPAAFARAVKAALARRNDRDQERLRKDFAAGHTWGARALEFQQLLAAASHLSCPPATVAGGNPVHHRPQLGDPTPVAAAQDPLPEGTS